MKTANGKSVASDDIFAIDATEIRRLTPLETEFVYGGAAAARPDLIACTVFSPERSTPVATTAAGTCGAGITILTGAACVIA